MRQRHKKRGYLVYEEAAARPNARFIELCMDAAEAHGLSLRLLFADEARRMDAPPPGDFALLRTREAALSRFFERGALRLFNSSYINESANDKLLCFERFRSLVPMLPSLDALLYEAPPFLPCVLKPRGGHGGRGVCLARDEAGYRAARAALLEQRPLVQPFARGGRDKRLYVVGGRIACAMLRTCETDFRSNYSLGGAARPCAVSPEEAAIAQKLHAHSPIGYAGVDILYDEAGRPLFNELEDPVGARMVYENTDVDLVFLLFSHIEKEL